MTQRALIFAALAEGRSRLSGLLHGGDAESTAGALRALGVPIPPLPADGGEFSVDGVGFGGLRAPSTPLDLGNSGTGTRLLLGVLAGAGVQATVTGDDSLRARPMARITSPLEAMGARFEWLGDEGRLPVRVVGTERLGPLDWTSPVASAQVKSALLLAGLVSESFVLLTEPRRSRDHTERMLRRVGGTVIDHASQGGWRVELRDPPSRIGPLDFHVPGDFSSAAFFLAAGALGVTEDREVTVEGVGLNPTRTAFLDVLRRMGAEVSVDETGSGATTAGPDGRGTGPGEPGAAEPSRGGEAEPIGDVTVRAGRLTATTVTEEEVPYLIDELPLVAALAGRAEGTTSITGARELRAKESDRITSMAENLGAVGVTVRELEDGLVVTGTTDPLAGVVRSCGDHRIAMAMGVLGALDSSRIEIDDPGVADVSFPGFWERLMGLTARGAAR